MTTLSNPPEQRRARYGAIVIGSGYGGSIVAARLAAAGHDVCVLERGKEWPTGSFPDELGGVIAQGIIHVRLPDFLRQLTTIRVRNSPSAGASATWLGRFGAFYFGEIWETYIRGHVPVADPPPPAS